MKAWWDRRAEHDRRASQWMAFERRLPRIVSAGKYVDVSLGGTVFLHIQRGAVAAPMPLSPTPFSIAVTRDGELQVSGSIRDGSGRLVAQLDNSRLLLVPGFAFDSNWDDRALEVVDESGFPRLQVFANDLPNLVETHQGPMRLEIKRDGQLGVVEIWYRDLAPHPDDSASLIAQEALRVNGASLFKNVTIKKGTRPDPSPTIFRYPSLDQAGCRVDGTGCG